MCIVVGLKRGCAPQTGKDFKKEKDSVCAETQRLCRVQVISSSGAPTETGSRVFKERNQQVLQESTA